MERTGSLTWGRTALLVAAAATAALVAFHPDDKPRYIGDFPSALEAQPDTPPPAPGEPAPPAAPVPAQPEPEPSAAQAATPRQAPAPAIAGVGQGQGGNGGGLRADPGPGADTRLQYHPGVSEDDGIGPAPGDDGYVLFPGRLSECADAYFVLDLGFVDCVTGEVRETDPRFPAPPPLPPVVDPVDPNTL